MKKITALLLAVSLHAFVQAQTLVSVNPNTALTGTTLTAQITGSGTSFQSSSPQGFFLEQGVTTIYASLATAVYMSNQNMTIDFNISPTTPVGNYTLQYMYEDFANPGTILTLSLPNAVTIAAPSLTITGNVFLDYNGNGTKDVGEPGIGGQKILITPDNQNVYTKSNGDYTIYSNSGSKTIAWQSSAANYSLSAGSQASYTGSISGTVGGYDFGLTNTGPALVSIAPDSVMAGTQLTAVISSAGTILQNSSPQGAILYDYIGNGVFSYGGGGISIINNTSFTSTFNLSNTTSTGWYNLYVYYLDTSGTGTLLTLPNSIYVYAPEIYIEGIAYSDRDSNATQGFSEPGIQGQIITLQPDNQTFITDGLGKFKLPTKRGNKIIGITTSGSYVVNPLASSSVSGNYQANTTGIEFPLLDPGPYLTSFSPDTVLAGTTITGVITGYATSFQSSSPPSSIMDSYIFKNNPFAYYAANPSTFSSTDDEHFSGDYSIPSNATPGWYDLYVKYEGPGATYVSLTLPNAVYIDQPHLFLEGYTYLDLDSNGIKSVGEPGIPNQKVKVQPDNVYVFSNSSGLFQAGSYAGTHTLTWDSTGAAFSLNAASPSSYSPNVSVTTAGFDFGLDSDLPPYTCDMITVSGTKRCNQGNYYSVTYRNTGLVTYDANIIIIKSSNTTFAAGTPAPSQLNGDTIVFNIANLAPYQYGNLYFYIGMPAAGSTVSVTGVMQSLSGSITVQSTDTVVNTGTVTCSFDPNDKAVTPAGVQQANYTLINDTLDYLIRFQNTGTDTAYVVVIRDTLDADLNLSSFRLIDASHLVQTQLDATTRIVTFTFNNIMLVDSTTNEAMSHGYVRYSISPLVGLLNTTPINNTAYIYFDFNEPVATNTTTNTLVYSIPTAIPEITPGALPMVQVVPNPFSQSAYIVFENKDRNAYRMVIYNTQGKLVADKTSNEETVLVEKENLNPGLYMFKLIPVEKGKTLSGKFIIK